MHSNVLVYSTVQYSTVQYSTVQYSTVQYSTVQLAPFYFLRIGEPRQMHNVRTRIIIYHYCCTCWYSTTTLESPYFKVDV